MAKGGVRQASPGSKGGSSTVGADVQRLANNARAAGSKIKQVMTASSQPKAMPAKMGRQYSGRSGK
jgi:hypothetical protein